METYTYKILEIDESAHTMIVQYTPTDTSLNHILINLPIPTSIDSIDSHVNTYAPQDTWYRVKNPAYDLSSIVGKEKSINPQDYPISTPESSTVNVVVTPDDQLASVMARLEAEFFAEQGNT
jgi:hypothetical protein